MPAIYSWKDILLLLFLHTHWYWIGRLLISVWVCPYKVVKVTCELWVSESLRPLVGCWSSLAKTFKLLSSKGMILLLQMLVDSSLELRSWPSCDVPFVYEEAVCLPRDALNLHLTQLEALIVDPVSDNWLDASPSLEEMIFSISAFMSWQRECWLALVWLTGSPSCLPGSTASAGIHSSCLLWLPVCRYLGGWTVHCLCWWTWAQDHPASHPICGPVS